MELNSDQSGGSSDLQELLQEEKLQEVVDQSEKRRY